jgi:hypothetical protein
VFPLSHVDGDRIANRNPEALGGAALVHTDLKLARTADQSGQRPR